jgi:OMF family outer membrane factor
MGRTALLCLLGLAGGCASFHPDAPASMLASRILAPAEAQDFPTPGSEEIPLVDDDEAQAVLSVSAKPTEVVEGGECGKPLTLAEALELADRNNPNLGVALENVRQARAGRSIAFSAFLPKADATYRAIGGSVPGDKFVLPTLPTSVGNLAFGEPNNDFRIAELHAQWTLWDFGRALSDYGQRSAETNIAQERFQRARQTVAYDVAAAYFQVLLSRAQQVVADEAVVRAESHLRDAKNYLRRKVADRNDVLRTDVLISQTKQEQVAARTARRISTAALNVQLGVNAGMPTEVVDLPVRPPFERSLADCLSIAVQNRPEFRAIQEGIVAARFGKGSADANLMPVINVGGVAAQQDGSAAPGSHIVAGGLSIELSLFEGGKRLAQIQKASSQVRAAVARAKAVCDDIAYETTAAYWRIDDARQRIVLAESQTASAKENLRVVNDQFRAGVADLTDVVDAEWALTRAQQGYFDALYAYQTALARLEYAVGARLLSEQEGGPQ